MILKGYKTKSQKLNKKLIFSYRCNTKEFFKRRMDS